jgi:hypothetical protein
MCIKRYGNGGKKKQHKAGWCDWQLSPKGDGPREEHPAHLTTTILDLESPPGTLRRVRNTYQTAGPVGRHSARRLARLRLGKILIRPPISSLQQFDRQSGLLGPGPGPGSGLPRGLRGTTFPCRVAELRHGTWTRVASWRRRELSVRDMVFRRMQQKQVLGNVISEQMATKDKPASSLAGARKSPGKTSLERGSPPQAQKAKRPALVFTTR